jgi:serine protease Do
MQRRFPLLLIGATILAAIVFEALMGSFVILETVQADASELDKRDRAYRELISNDHAMLEGSRVLARIAKLTTPSVVHIQSTRVSEIRGTVEETGSGVLVKSSKAKGVFVVTNRHVLEDAPLEDISIQLYDGRVIHPIQIWNDPATDISLLKVSDDHLLTARWGDSDLVEIGHGVLAMGSPFGLSRSVTFGIISAKGRRSLRLGKRSRVVNTVINQDFLQTDAAINPGNSGGPLIDLHGRVIGINTAIASNSGGNDGIGFSIPSNLVRRVVDEVLEFGKVRRAYLGVTLDSHFNEAKVRKLKLDRLRGARVTEVHTKTPASRARLQINDVILEFSRIVIQDENHLIHLVSLTPIGKQIDLLVLRDGKRITIPVLLGDRTELQLRSETPAPPDSQGDEIELMQEFKPIGLTLKRLNASLAGQLGLEDQTGGLLVLRTNSVKPSDDELQLYDVIVEAARKPIHTVDDLNRVLSSLSANDSVLLKVRRHFNGKTHHRLVIWRPSSLSETPSAEKNVSETGIDT